MGEVLRKRLQQSRFGDPVQEAVLNVLVAAGHLRDRMERALGEEDITLGQYNVLRILRGAHPGGHPRCEIARRMLERAPDVTRLIDRLESRGLVERTRSEEDKRLSITRVTRRGLELLERVQPGVESAHRELAARLSAREARELSRLCERLYGEEEAP